MAFSYFDRDITQDEIGDKLRPYQNSKGINDDKSTTLEEMAQFARGNNLFAYHRPAGSVEMLKKFIANDIPVITRTLTAKD